MTPILTLDATTRAQLRAIRDRDATPYRRERASALLQIAEGQTPTAVARTGLLRPRHPRTVTRWLAAFAAGGLTAVMTQRPRRRAFSP